MKKNLKKLAALIMAIIIIATCAIPVFAAGVSKSQAEEIALKNAGLTAKEVVMDRTDVDYESGKKVYEVEFYVNHGDGWKTEYDYVIDAADGKILRSKAEKEFDEDLKPITPPANNGAADIGKEKAIQLALEAFGLNEKDVKLVKAKKDYDDGRLVYEIEFREGYEKEYSCEVDAETGRVYDKEIEINRKPADKIELFFESFRNIFSRIFG